MTRRRCAVPPFQRLAMGLTIAAVGFGPACLLLVLLLAGSDPAACALGGVLLLALLRTLGSFLLPTWASWLAASAPLVAALVFFASTAP